MTATISGTPQSVAPGGNYTAASGSNRKVLVFSAVKQSATGTATTCSTITYNGIARAPTVQICENGADKLMAVAVAQFLESECSPTPVAVNHSWDRSLGSERLYCVTVQDTSQGAASDTDTVSSDISPPSLSLSPTVVGGIMFAVGANRVAAAWTGLTAGWTELFDETQGSAGMLLAWAAVDATSEAFVTDDPGEYAMLGIALEPTGSSPVLDDPITSCFPVGVYE